MFVSNGNFIFKEVEERISKNGKSYTVVKLIDKDNYQHLDFFGSSDLSVTCKENSMCKVVLRASKVGYSTSMDCVSVTAV